MLGSRSRVVSVIAICEASGLQFFKGGAGQELGGELGPLGPGSVATLEHEIEEVQAHDKTS